MVTIDKAAYNTFLKEIKEQVYRSQYQALKEVNKELLDLYWFIGKCIAMKQEQSGWGKSVVGTLAADLQKEFSGIKGFSGSNLWRMKSFFEAYNKNEKLAPMVREIAWSHNLVILEKCKDEHEREFYIRMTSKYGWTKNVLVHQVEGQVYQRYLMNQTNFDNALEEQYRHQAKLAVRDSYTFGFLEISESYSERELELGLIKNIRSFLMEMGGDFAFMGNQYRLEIGNEEYYIDLLLYHRRLKSLVAIELKTGKFKAEYAGKMQFYLTALNETVKTTDENASIGIIICKEKNRTIVEYALKEMNSPMGVATYTIKAQLPENMKMMLPSPAEIAESLEKLI
jgi:predicted nuclease of restriction endonuclease-like (RecB) superfamily